MWQCSEQCGVYSEQRAVSSEQCEGVQCAIAGSSAQCAVCSEQCVQLAVCSLQCAVSSVHMFKKDILQRANVFKVLWLKCKYSASFSWPIVDFSMLCAECNELCAVSSVLCAVCCVHEHCAVCRVQCAVFSELCSCVQCTVTAYSEHVRVHCAANSVQCAVSSVLCAVCSVQCAVSSVQCAVDSQIKHIEMTFRTALNFNGANDNTESSAGGTTTNGTLPSLNATTRTPRIDTSKTSTSITQQKKVTVRFNQEIVLLCKDLKYSTTMISWFKHQENSTSDIKHKLDIKRYRLDVTSQGGGGTYSCLVTNNSFSVNRIFVVHASIALLRKTLNTTRIVTCNLQNNVTPSIEISPCCQIVIANETETINIKCLAAGFPTPTVTWILPNGSEWLVEDLKEYNDTAGISSLVVTAYDGGNYKCIANNRNGNAEQTVTVFVTPSIEISPCCQIVIANETETINIKCLAAGFPTPTVTWILPNGNEWLVEDLKEYNDTAGISSLVVTEYDGGNYTCIANNRNGNAEQTVTVFVQPRILPFDNDSLVVTVYSNVSSVPCTAVGFPPPDVYWYHGDKQLSTLVSSLHNVDRTTKRRTLSLGEVDWSHKGEYSCTANNTIKKNKASFANKSIFLKLLSDIKFSSFNSTADGYVGDNLTLSCSVTGKSEHELRWTTENVSLSNETNSTTQFTISNLELDYGSKKYVCEARTIADNKTIYSSVRIRVLNETVRFDDISVFLGGKNTLECIFMGKPQPKVTIETSGELHTDAKVTALDGMKNIYKAVIQKRIKWRDAGKASCRIYYENSTVQVVGHATVNIYPYITSHPTEVIKSFNDTQQFECTAAGYPLPKIYWQKKLNGQDYHFVSEVLLMAADVSDHEISSTLTLNKSISSAGDYRCITTSSVTNPQSYPENRPNVSNPVQYIVKSDARIISNDPIVARSGETVTITCNATGYPLPQIRWSHKEESNMIESSREKKSDTSIESYLEIPNVTVDDGGSYYCTASNIGEQSQANINVNVKPSINIRPCCEHVIDKEKINEIKCSATGLPTPTVTWIFPNGSRWPNNEIPNYNSSSLVFTEQDGELQLDTIFPLEKSIGHTKESIFVLPTVP
ncbi:hemicentin-1-like [Corticium candelabrum]|uniref:hemicentin-1-like n=1 Tax=Corticium candelabrum TaxID=121492 RepID=UPI002E264A76|nr:hemicentin-1-like [Corticium candelabrum]